MNTTRTIIRLLGTTALLALAGCATSDSHGDVRLVAETTTTQAAAPSTTVAPAAAPGCTDENVTASWEPDTPLPEVGAMPKNSTMAGIVERGKLRVGVSADTLQFGARNPLNGNIEGFDIDMLHAVAKALFGDENAIDYKVITYAQRIPALEAQDVDIVAHTMTINCVRWNRIAFSSEYYSAGQKLLVSVELASTGIKDLGDMDGRTVCVAAGSTNEEFLKTFPNVDALTVADLTDCVVAFQQGKADGITGDDTVLAGFAAQDPYAVVLPKAFTSEPYGLGMNANNGDLVRFVNSVLEQVRTDGRWKASYAKWVDPNNPATPPTARYGRAEHQDGK